ncbi:MAG: hypothetical protein WCC08_16900, partial [Terrimicrobiaceae bacterium]
MAAFPVLKPGRPSHYMISGLAQCSFALRPARSLTPFKGAFSIEGFGRLVASSPAPIATGWSEICRVGFLFNSPTGVLRLSHGALQQSARTHDECISCMQFACTFSCKMVLFDAESL